MHVGLATGTVRSLISNYNRYGPDALEGLSRAGFAPINNYQPMSARFIGDGGTYNVYDPAYNQWSYYLVAYLKLRPVLPARLLG
jgi:hypothetical protein